jgi:glucan-binding YG repeat protein
MRIMKNKFIALLMVFTSIVSFLPVGFSGQAVRAAYTAPAEATDVRVNVDGTSTPLTQRTDSTIKETIYTTDNVEKAFDITVKNFQKSETAIIDEAENAKQSISDVFKQEVVIVAINQTKLAEKSGNGYVKNQAGYNVIAQMGITVSTNDLTPVKGDTQRIGAKISNLPAGINKITYAVVITSKKATYTKTLDANGKDTGTGTASISEDDTETYTPYQEDITIEHASKYAVNEINSMLFKAYVGDSSEFTTDGTGKDTVIDASTDQNIPPFLYLTNSNPDSNAPLRYNFDVPDSLTSLKYVMTFGSMLDISKGVTLFKNGTEAVEGTDYTINTSAIDSNGKPVQQLTGDLKNPSQPDLIVIKVNSVADSSTSTVNIAKAYAVEIRYNKLEYAQDHSLKAADITKLDMNEDDSVQAYIGKIFNVDKNNGYPTYTGNIYIDPRANKISIDPTLWRSKSATAYVVTNQYHDSSGKAQTEKTELKDGKQYINFNMLGAQDNAIQVDVYAGENGSVTASTSSTILARYYLKVNLLKANVFNMGLQFSGAGSPHLTQPGVPANTITFNTSRRTYDLYFNHKDPINVKLAGRTDDVNQYIRVYLSDSLTNDNYTEIDASKNNALVNNVRSTTVEVTLGASKKMMIQAYYDKFENQTVNGVTQKVFVGSYPIGDTYVFYLPENHTSADDSTQGTKSSIASLSSLKVKGYTIKNSDGNTGFSSTKYDYTTTVAKEDTVATITAITEDYNAKSIVGTVNGKDDSYDLTSGEASEITLNSSGTTTITIVVTAQDGTTTKTYTLTVKNNKKGSSAQLKNVYLNTGEFTFDPKGDVTKVRVDPNMNKIKVTPVPVDSKAKVEVNGDVYSSAAIEVSIKGAQTSEIQIKVTSEDGAQSKTYTLEVTRVDASAWDDSNNDDKYDDDQYYDQYNDCWVDLKKYEEWGTVNGKSVYFDNKNRQVKNAWITTGGKTYYLNNLGYRASGWKVDEDDGKKYYLDPKTGEMKTGWINLNNSWYYLALNGVMKTGWLSLNGKWYYFTPNGQMIINQSMYIDGKVYNFGQDGAVIS